MASLDETVSEAPETADALLVLERIDEGFYAIDRRWRLRYVNASAERFWNMQRRDLIGRSMLDVFERFPGSDSHRAHEQAMATGTPGRLETVSTATGANVELKLFPLADGLSVYFRDVSSRRHMEEELKTTEELLELAELSAGIGVWVGDLTNGTVRARPEFFRLLGIEPVDGPIPVELPRTFRHPDDRERNTQAFQRALASGAESYESEYRIIRPSGEQRWIFGRGRITRDANGKPWRYSGVDLDITERKKQEDHLRIVMAELLHRTNNLLAVVQGVARQSARNSKGLEDFVPAFSARLQALGESGSLLARQDWRGAPLDELIRAQISPFAEANRFEIAGPPVLLSPKAAQNIGLAIHELSTNAIKYGALKLPTGRVRVSWATSGEMLRIVWREEGGPPVVPPTRAGFGRVVTERMIASALAAVVKTSFAPAGVEWVLELPAAEFSLI